MSRAALVMGASGFLGSHVTRQLVRRGDRTRIWVRESATTRAFEGLDVEVHRGGLGDTDAMRAAMTGVDAVHYCIVNTDPNLPAADLWDVNVSGLRNALDAAVAVAVPKFLFCSSIATMGIARPGEIADETTERSSVHEDVPYIRVRVAAEQLVLEYVRDRGLAAVVLNPANTYGPYDFAGVLHGRLVKAAAHGLLSAYLPGSAELVGVEDAARAFLLAEERGRAGERYIISDRYLPWRTISDVAAEIGGAAPPGDALQVGETASDPRQASLQISQLTSPMSHEKATRELGWIPNPVELSIRRAALFYTDGDPEQVPLPIR